MLPITLNSVDVIYSASAVLCAWCYPSALCILSYGTDSKRNIQLVGGSKRSGTLPGFSWLVSGKPATESPILCILSMLSH